MTTGRPVFGLLATSAVGFKIKVDFHLSSPVRHGFLTFTFGATSTNLFAQVMKTLVNVSRHTDCRKRNLVQMYLVTKLYKLQ